MSNEIVRSRAPVRIDFAGGWTDVALFAEDEPGAVVNAAISVHSYASIRPQGSADSVVPRARIDERNITIYSADFDVFIEADNIAKLEYDGNVDLVKAALRRMEIDAGFDIITRSNAPPGSGLGTSAAMGVALLGALDRLKAEALLPYELAELASEIERKELGIRGGKQDHYASALGGLCFMEFSGERVTYARLPLARDTIRELQKSLVLCYTGRSRLSGDLHARVVEAFTNGEKKTVESIRRMKIIARKMKEALLRGKLPEFAKLMSANWECQKALHPTITNEEMEELFAHARENGAIGGKACGAGGGGCVIFYCKPDREHKVRAALEEANAHVLDFEFDFDGLQTWTTPCA